MGSVGSTLTQRMVLFKHPLHGAGWAGSGASSEARVRARREPSQAARPAAVTDPVTTKSAPARQAGLPAPRFLSNHRNAALPARGRRGGAAADSTESRGGNEPAERSVWRCSRDAGSHAADPDVVATAFASFPLPFLGAPRFAATVRSGTFRRVEKPGFSQSVLAAAVGAGWRAWSCSHTLRFTRATELGSAPPPR